MSQWLTALLVGGIVGVGLAPIVLAFAWLPMRRKSAEEEVTPQQRLEILRNTGFALLAIVLVTAVAFTLFKTDAPVGGPGFDGSDISGAGGDMPGMSGAGGDMPGMAGMPGAPSMDAALPSRLGGLPLSQKLTGDQALQQVASIHSSDIPVTSAVVGFYRGDGREATVWAASTSAPEMAGAMSDEMAQAIAAGDTPFGTPRQMSNGVWELQGMGQVHYFFRSGNGVWWVSADPSVAEKSLDQVRTAAGL